MSLDASGNLTAAGNFSAANFNQQFLQTASTWTIGGSSVGNHTYTATRFGNTVTVHLNAFSFTAASNPQITNSVALPSWARPTNIAAAVDLPLFITNNGTYGIGRCQITSAGVLAIAPTSGLLTGSCSLSGCVTFIAN